MLREIRALLASAEQAKVFGGDRYDWYTYLGDRPFKLDFRGKTVSIEKGERFGVRDATSKSGQYRVVFESQGNSRVMSPEQSEVKRLIAKSKLAKVK